MTLPTVPGITTYPPATPAEAQAAEEQLGFTLPDQLRDIWSESNGFELPAGFTMYGTQDIAERNRTWETSRYAPGYVVVGDDSGGRLVVMVASPRSTEAFSTDSGDLQPTNFTLLGQDLLKWIEEGASTEVQDSHAQVALASVDVILERAPAHLRELISLKESLGLQASIGHIKRGLADPPVLLAEGVPYQKYKNRVDRLPAHLRVLISLRPSAL